MGGSPASSCTPCISQRRKPQSRLMEKLSKGLEQQQQQNEGETSDSDTDSSSELRQARHVLFANVEVREYAVTIGDHPCCTIGCPLTLDWDYTVARVTTVEKYEAQRSPRRSRDQLRTTAPERMRLLSEESGLSDGELRRATRKLFRARSCSARLSEKMSESFFRSDAQCQPHALPASNHVMEHASPCA